TSGAPPRIASPSGASLRSFRAGWLRGPLPIGVIQSLLAFPRSTAVTRAYGGLRIGRLSTDRSELIFRGAAGASCAPGATGAGALGAPDAAGTVLICIVVRVGTYMMPVSGSNAMPPQLAPPSEPGA